MSFSCDGTETQPKLESVIHPLMVGYVASKVSIPEFSTFFEMKYSLSLSGQTGCCPYVRERITPAFTFIRWETFCYPIFAEDWAAFRDTGINECSIRLTVPKAFDVVASERVQDIHNDASHKHITYTSHEKSASIFNCSIAPYATLEFSFGKICFLGSIDSQKKASIECAMQDALDYMNRHFGCKELAPSITYASIPDGFGSFACTDAGVVFIQESTFDKIENLNQIIHEFIHLAWNAKAKDTVQRARFFDEAFTSYFETRVMRHLLHDESMTGYRYGQYGIDAIKEGKYQLVPICEYAEMGYGDLSYTIGAMCLEALCTLVGEAIFDRATTAFLIQYADEPADFEDFCAAYSALCGKENEAILTRFFDDWIYTCNAIAQKISS